MYSLVYQAIAGTNINQAVAIEHFVLELFATPLCATNARVSAPLYDDYAGNPWLIVILWHG
jgi:hypothetical protein